MVETWAAENRKRCHFIVITGVGADSKQEGANMYVDISGVS